MKRQKTKDKNQKAKGSSILSPLLPLALCPLPFALFSFAL
jgi:hypothetical protein